MTRNKLALRSLALAALGLSALGPPAWSQPASTPPAAEATVDVRGFTITGNTLLDATAMAGLLARYKGRRSFAELQEAAQTVQSLYAEAGYGAVVAYLPPQPMDDGNVTIAVVEGKVAKVTVRGAQRLSEERVRAALPTLVEGQTPRVRSIDAELQIANENPSRQMGVLLGPGANTGEVEATINVEEQPVHRFNVGIDNSGNDRTGDYRLTAGWQHADITGHDDILTLQVQTSPTEWSAVQVASIGYRLPLPRWRTAIDLFAAHSDVDGGTTTSPAGNLSFAGRGRIAGMRSVWYLPRAGEFDQRASFGLDHRVYLNDCHIDGLPDGACGPAGESVTVHPLSLEYFAQSGSRIVAGANAGIFHNLGIGGEHTDQASFDAVRLGAPRDYTLLRAGGYVTVPVGLDWTVGGRLSLQHTGDALVPGEQFGIGGINSVRGYEEREVAGDRGVFASLEVATPKLGWADNNKVDLRLVAFADAGQVRNVDAAPCAGVNTRCSVASAGLGARLNVGSVQARLFVANALKEGITTQEKDWRTHFLLATSF